MSIEIVERFGWEQEMRRTWDQRCKAIAQEIWERGGDGPLSNTSSSEGWGFASQKVDGVEEIYLNKPVDFGSDDDEDPAAEGHISVEFHADAGIACAVREGEPLSTGELRGPTMPVSAYASCNGAMIPLREVADQLAPVEVPVWEVYSGLIRYADSTLNDYGLKWVLDEMRAVLKTPVGADPRLGADPKESLLFAYRMMQDPETREALNLHEAYAAVDKATAGWPAEFRARIDEMKAEMQGEDTPPAP